MPNSYQNRYRSSSIAVSTGLSALTAMFIVIASVLSSIYSLGEVEIEKQKETLKNVLQQHGDALGRELKVQTFWSEGYKNTRELNTQWMGEFYGPYLDKLLGYKRLYVLNGQDQGIYSYEDGSNSEGSKFDATRAGMSDLIRAIRSNNSEVTTRYRINEANFDLGESQTVVHRFLADVRNVGGIPAVVVVSTILPDSPQTDPVEALPFLMVAVNPIDQRQLDKLGGNFSFYDLRWGRSETSGSSLRITGLDGHVVGELSWISDNPGWTLGKKLLPGLCVAVLLLIAIAAFLVRRNYAQASSLERYSRKLAKVNETLEKRVDARTRELEATFENVAQGVVLLGPDQQVVISNQKAKELLDAETDEALQHELNEVCSAAHANLATSERRHLPTGTTRTDIIRNSGRHVEVRQTRLPDGGAVLTISDVSALKKRQVELETATNAANAANEAKSRFLSTMSHEMRTPLNGIIGALELVKKTSMTEDQAQLIELAGKSSEALLVQINDVLDFSKLEAEKFELTHESFDLIRTVTSVRDIVRSQAEHRKNKLIIDIAPDVARHVIGDAVRLRQILLNLVSNANKFTRDGAISINVRVAGGTSQTPLIELAVKDTGVGIAPEKLGSLFKEFSMIESEYKRSGGGTGLGLAISKRLTEAMDGEIAVESSVGVGSIFRLCIPFSVADLASEAGEADEDETERPSKRLRILLVDDNSTNRLVGSRLLESVGHTVTTANDGRQAVALVEQGSFDVVLMDVSMPEMDGLEATAEIRKLAKPVSSVPVIALTANAVIGDRERFLAVGMNDYVSKPFRLRDLQERLSKHTSPHPRSVACTSTSHESISLDAALPLIDDKELDALAAETSEEIVAAIVDEFVKELCQHRANLKAASAGQDHSAVEKLCHAISGASRSVGASRLAKIARGIELACAAPEVISLGKAVDNIDSVIDETLNEFKKRQSEEALKSAA